MELNGGGIVARGLIWGATDKPSRYHIHIIITESDPFWYRGALWCPSGAVRSAVARRWWFNRVFAFTSFYGILMSNVHVKVVLNTIRSREPPWTHREKKPLRPPFYPNNKKLLSPIRNYAGPQRLGCRITDVSSVDRVEVLNESSRLR